MTSRRVAGPARPSRAHRVLLAAAVASVGLLGALLGLLVAGTVSAPVGPFQADLSLRPSLSGSTEVAIPPLGALQLDSHEGPVRLAVEVERLRSEAARSIVAEPASLEGLGDDVVTDLRRGVEDLVVRTVLVTVAGAALLGLLVFRRWRATLAAVGVGVVALGASAGVAAATIDQRSLAEPRFTGLLASAPAAVGDVREIVERFDAYRLQLGRLVANVSELYTVTRSLPVFTATDETVRVLWVSDLHLNPAAFEVIESVVEQFGIEVVVDTGDLTDWGSQAETRYVEGIGGLDVPYLWVRGNHDSTLIQSAVAEQPNATVLDSTDVVEVAGLRFLGMGDPRFTPDKTTGDDNAPKSELTSIGREMRRAVTRGSADPDVVLVHDPISAEPLFGEVPLVLAGHAHERRKKTVEDTLLLVQGSTGGAGLRALEGEEPTPVMLTVLYFDPDTGRLQAYDDITLGGLGVNDARISRTVVPKEDEAVSASPSGSPAPSPASSPGPALSPTPSPSPSPAASPVPAG